MAAFETYRSIEAADKQQLSQPLETGALFASSDERHSVFLATSCKKSTHPARIPGTDFVVGNVNEAVLGVARVAGDVPLLVAIVAVASCNGRIRRVRSADSIRTIFIGSAIRTNAVVLLK